MEHEPRDPGSEEYRDSEKYEIRHWGLASTGMRELIATVNRIRHEHAALRHDRTLRFHPVDNDELIAYSKTLPDGGDPIVVVVNLDPAHPQSGFLDLRMPELGMDWDEAFVARDLLTGEAFSWTGARNYVELHPSRQPGHVLSIEAERTV
jgi:starch synthase (maltosyl-transferring)